MVYRQWCTFTYGGAGFEAWNTLSVGPSALAVLLSLTPPLPALSSGSMPPPEVQAAEDGGDGDWCLGVLVLDGRLPLVVYGGRFAGLSATVLGVSAGNRSGECHCFLGKWGKKVAEVTKKAEDPVGDMWQHCTMYGGLIDARFKSQDHGVKSALPHSTIEKTFGGNHISTTTTQFRIWFV